MAAWLVSVSCGQVEGVPLEPMPPVAEGATKVVVVRSDSAAPDRSDATPRVALARRGPDGTSSPIDEEYIDAVEFGTGQAAVTQQHELHLVTSKGTRSVLARQLDGLPSRADDGSLVYAARFGEVVEIYRLSLRGSSSRLASFRGSATRLAPQPDGSVVFVGAKLGGVSGVWLVDEGGARCLTNCELRVGQRWGDSYRPPPGDTTTVSIVGSEVRWQSAEGDWHSAPLGDEQ